MADDPFNEFFSSSEYGKPPLLDIRDKSKSFDIVTDIMGTVPGSKYPALYQDAGMVMGLLVSVMGLEYTAAIQVPILHILTTIAGVFYALGREGYYEEDVDTLRE